MMLSGNRAGLHLGDTVRRSLASRLGCHSDTSGESRTSFSVKSAFRCRSLGESPRAAHVPPKSAQAPKNGGKERVKHSLAREIPVRSSICLYSQALRVKSSMLPPPL